MYPECRHIMPDGAKCHSPAMRGMAYCYYHTPGRRSGRPPLPKNGPATPLPQSPEPLSP